MTGWWYTYPSEKYEFVSWDEYSQYMENRIHVPNHQSDEYRTSYGFRLPSHESGGPEDTRHDGELQRPWQSTSIPYQPIKTHPSPNRSNA